MLFNRYAAAATDGGGAGTESTANDSSSTPDVNGAPGTAAEATTVATTPPTDNKENLRKAFAERVNKANAAKDRELAEALAELEIEVPEGENPIAVLATLKDRLAAPKQAQSDLEKITKQAKVAETERARLALLHQEYVEKTEVSNAINAFSERLVPGAIPTLHDSFLANHKIKNTADGVKVYDRAGQILYSEDGAEMTTKQAFEKFIEDKNWALTAQVKSAIASPATAGNMRGAGTTTGKIGISRADLAAGKANPDDLKKGRYTIID
jgi:hypothetical protein